jgi:putative nucleotidyltransferase with HDIG domain
VLFLPQRGQAVKKRILFVDDDPNVLDGLRRMLYPLRREWDMAFAAGAKQALDMLAESTFDVIVTDLRMPEMDGVEFLAEVRQRCPDTVRITLSGQVDQSASLRSVGTAHQFLAKPCDSETLRNAIARACALRDLLRNEELKGMVSRMSSLPVLPELYLELIDELRSPEASLKTVGRLMSQDVGMTAKVLQLVNSAFFGLPRQVSNPVQAVNLLGLETVRALVLSVHVFSQWDEFEIEGFCVRALENHSLATGLQAKRIAAEETSAGPIHDDLLAAGLLHDIGKLVLAANLPTQYGQVLITARDQKLPIEQAERQLLGTSHAEVGAYLLGLWGLPDPVVEAAAFHHEPQLCPANRFCALTAVHVADVLEHETGTPPDQARARQIDTAYLDRLGLSGHVDNWRRLAQSLASQRAES